MIRRGAGRIELTNSPAGAHPSGRLGEEPKGRPGNLLPLLAQIAAGREKTDLKIFGNDYPTPYVFASLVSRCPAMAELTNRDGTCVRDYLHVMDLAKGHVLALDALASSVSSPSTGIFSKLDVKADGYYRAFNLGKGKGMSVLNMIEAMKKATGFDYQYEIVGRR